LRIDQLRLLFQSWNCLFIMCASVMCWDGVSPFGCIGRPTFTFESVTCVSSSRSMFRFEGILFLSTVTVLCLCSGNRPYLFLGLLLKLFFRIYLHCGFDYGWLAVYNVMRCIVSARLLCRVNSSILESKLQRIFVSTD
jgi:hypothetical protein